MGKIVLFMYGYILTFAGGLCIPIAPDGRKEWALGAVILGGIMLISTLNMKPIWNKDIDKEK